MSSHDDAIAFGGLVDFTGVCGNPEGMLHNPDVSGRENTHASTSR